MIIVIGLEGRQLWGNGELWLAAAALTADLAEPAVGHALVAGKEHSHAVALVALASRGPRHLALLAVLEPVAALEGAALPREVDLLSCRIAAR